MLPSFFLFLTVGLRMKNNTFIRATADEDAQSYIAMVTECIGDDANNAMVTRMALLLNKVNKINKL